MPYRTGLVLPLLISVGLLSACVQAPTEPITINLNIKLDADVRLKVEEQAQEDIASNPDIFGGSLDE